MSSTARSRMIYAALTLCVIGLGLASRKFPWLFPAAFGKYPGDSLWALMVLFGLSVLAPNASVLKRAAWALLFSFGIEFSQLYQAPWINSIRGTTLGHLVLGSDFSGWDLVAYTIGIVFGVMAEAVARRVRGNY